MSLFPRPIVNRLTNHFDGMFIFEELDVAGGENDFSTSYAKTDTPVEYFEYRVYPHYTSEGFITRIHYRLNPTNVATYTLRLYQRAAGVDITSNLQLLYESAAGRADDVEYDVLTEPIPFKLATQGVMYYAVEWTAAPGVTPGFISVTGVGAR